MKELRVNYMVVRLSRSILIAGGLVAAALVVGRILPLYRFAPGIDGGGNPMLWRANVLTGAIEICPAQRILSAKAETEKVDPSDPFQKIVLGPAYGRQCQ